MGMKFLTELVRESQVVEEVSDTGEKRLYVEGIFLQSNIKNKNGRIYPKPTMDKEVGRYIKETVNAKCAWGELDHPQGPKMNSDRISHRIVSLKEDGDNYIGKAIILETPLGNIAKALIKDGAIGISSRGLGSVKNSNGALVVQEDFKLVTAGDIVLNPSAPDAWLSPLMEETEWIWDGSELKEVALNNLKESLDKKKLDEDQILAGWQKFVKIIAENN